MPTVFKLSRNRVEVDSMKDLHSGVGSFLFVPQFGHIPGFLYRRYDTYYCHTLEEALKRAKMAGKRSGCR